ncbi:MAG: GDSL-type esterase/lipase family protein [Nitrospirota bacterium]
MPPQPPSIICFGDSLTAGFRSPTREDPFAEDAPYGAFLQDRLGKRAVVKVSGVCGELTADMARRFPRDVIAQKPWLTVVLGGTNDLGWRIPTAEIFRNLRTMYQQAIDSEIHVAAVTVPSIRGDDSYVSGRYELNALVAEHCDRNSIPWVDLFTATAEPTTGRLGQPYSNDGLHLTVAGYQLLADLLYQQVFERLLSKRDGR